jgi:hypothetical protein
MVREEAQREEQETVTGNGAVRRAYLSPTEDKITTSIELPPLEGATTCLPTGSHTQLLPERKL